MILVFFSINACSNSRPKISHQHGLAAAVGSAAPPPNMRGNALQLLGESCHRWHTDAQLALRVGPKSQKMLRDLGSGCGAPWKNPDSRIPKFTKKFVKT